MKPLRILIVDDDVSIGALLAEIVTDLGHTVCSVETTQASAVNAALVARPDLMIVDVRLGRGSGIAAMERILETVRVPHIFVSGDWGRQERNDAIVLQKPFTQRDLVQAIEQTMRMGMAARPG